MATQEIKIKSPHDVRISAPIGLSHLTAYPGWRWRHDEQDGAMYHERISNPLARWLDIAKRKFFSSVA